MNENYKNKFIINENTDLDKLPVGIYYEVMKLLAKKIKLPYEIIIWDNNQQDKLAKNRFELMDL